MATGDFKVFDYTLDGLHLSVTATERADGQVDMVVTQIGAGYADINALYWNDGNAVDDNPLSGYSGFTGAKNESSLAMTGVGEVWDGGVKVSNTGLGTNPSVNKAGYLDHDGDTYSLVANVSLAQLETLGVRATSTSVVDPVTGLAGGSIKAVDDGELHEHSYKAVHTWDFESDNVDSGNGYVDNGLTLFTQTVPIDWTGSTVEIQAVRAATAATPTTALTRINTSTPQRHRATSASRPVPALISLPATKRQSPSRLPRKT